MASATLMTRYYSGRISVPLTEHLNLDMFTRAISFEMVNNGPWVASELGPLIPQQRTCSDYGGMSV
jgi:hypothetical protein